MSTHLLLKSALITTLSVCWSVLSFSVTHASGGIGVNLDNFLAFSTLEEFVVAILNVFIIIATPIVVLFIIYAGFLYVTARGNAEQTQKATQALVYAIIGGVIMIGAVALSEILANVVGAFRA